MLQITEGPIKLRIAEQGHTPVYTALRGTDVSAGFASIVLFWENKIPGGAAEAVTKAGLRFLRMTPISHPLHELRLCHPFPAPWPYSPDAANPIWEHTFVRREPHHLSSVESLELPRIKNAIIKCCVLMLLGQLIHTALSIYWPRHTQEEGKGPFFHNGNICPLNRILGLFMGDFLTCPPNLFPKACHNQSPGKSPTWWETVGTISKSDSKWDSAERRWPCSYPWAHGHRSQCFCQSMSLSHPQERRYSVCANTKCQGITLRFTGCIARLWRSFRRSDVDKHSGI